MADNTYQPGTYRERGGDRFVIASSGSADVESGGEIDIESGGVLKVGGSELITTGGTIDLSTAGGFIGGDINTTGEVDAVGGFVSTGASYTSTGSGVAAKFDAVTSTGTGTFNAVTSTGLGTFNAVTSTGTITGAAVTSTGAGTFDSVTTTGGAGGAISGQRILANTGYQQYVEAITSGGTTEMTAYGISTIYAATALTVDLNAPVAGVVKWISVVSTAATVTITSSSAGADFTTAGSTHIAFTTGLAAAPGWIHLIGLNSTRWTVLAQSTGTNVI
ncbi:hypothetical protein LCGC14_0313420 [marine sediment metagenome]|uniref:Uncharacterized protein n=1 Tax=marine sediment metagenome TaxID=412755 RepID=A0A0F9TLP7_9ZZZZ